MILFCVFKLNRFGKGEYVCNKYNETSFYIYAYKTILFIIKLIAM